MKSWPVRQLISVFASILCATGAAAPASREWIKLEDCVLVPNDSNDGDSFHIRSGETEYLIRLYLVDAPEIEGIGASRLVEQAGYFGVTVPEVIEVGRRAKRLVDEKMAKPFTVFTHMAGGLGRSKIQRILGFVQVQDGDLGELLVFNGLARIHGTRGAPPGIASSADEIARLQSLEQKAKEARRGGWNVSGMAAQNFEAVPSVDIVPFARAEPSPAKKFSAPATPAHMSADVGAGQLDINTATQEELEKLPGVGRVTSYRIMAARPFQNADELYKIKGIGHGKRYEDLRRYFQ